METKRYGRPGIRWRFHPYILRPFALASGQACITLRLRLQMISRVADSFAKPPVLRFAAVSSGPHFGANDNRIFPPRQGYGCNAAPISGLRITRGVYVPPFIGKNGYPQMWTCCRREARGYAAKLRGLSAVTMVFLAKLPPFSRSCKLEAVFRPSVMTGRFLMPAMFLECSGLFRE
jgi:hypothetical protein